MNEQIKKIYDEPKNIKSIPENQEINSKQNPGETITKLPQWSIEPPLKIKRGQK